MILALLAVSFLALGSPPAPAPVPAPAKVARNSLDEVVCKKTVRTGSLVASTRLCMTRREWTRSAEISQAEWGALQGIQGNTRENQPTWMNGTPP